jgi:ABC-type branched-subunit amino acid transport system substrate-binding protein
LFKISLILSIIFNVTCFSGQALSVNNIKLGMSNALTGPASYIGKGVSRGAAVYFEQLNNAGGINGQQVELISLDDAYEPKNTIKNIKKFIIQEDVLALLNFMGTPSSHAILPILKQSNIPFLMPLTGADFLRTPVINNIFNLRSSYLQEAQAQIEFLIEVKKVSKIALVIQADEFGLAAQRSYEQIFKKYNIVPVITERYKRNTNDIERVLDNLATMPLDTVIFVGTYQPLSYLINLGYEQGIRAYFSTLSFVSSSYLFARLEHPSKVIVSEVIPSPYQCQWRICKKFIRDMKQAGYVDFNKFQLEGYLNAHLFSLVAKQCGTTLTRACLLEEFNSFKYEQNELNISFSPDNHQGLNQVHLSFSDTLKAEN